MQITLHPTPRGDDDIRKWMISNNGVYRATLVMLAFFFVICSHTAIKMYLKLRQATKVAATGSTMGKRKNRFVIQFSGILIQCALIMLLNCALLPNGAFLQTLGVYKPFGDSNNYVWGSSETDPRNLLCAPIGRFILMITSTVIDVALFGMCSPWAPPSWYQRNLPEQTPQWWKWLFPSRFFFGLKR